MTQNSISRTYYPSSGFFLRLIFQTFLVFLFLSPITFSLQPVQAASFTQTDDPVVQCAEGLKLFSDGKHAEALPLLEAGFANRANAHFEQPGDLGLCALMLGFLDGEIGKTDEALEADFAALQAFREGGNQEIEGVVLTHMGLMYAVQGQYAEALEYYQQALVVERKVGDQGHESLTLGNIGEVYRKQGRYPEALDQIQQALVIARKIGNEKSEATALNNISAVYDALGRSAEALEYYQQALVIERELDDRKSQGITLGNIGELYRRQGRYAEALEQFQQALKIAGEVGDRTGEGLILNNIGGVADDQGQYLEALKYYQQALAITQETGDHAVAITTLNNLGTIYYSHGRYAEALEQFQQVLMLQRKVGDRKGEGQSLSNIGALYDAQGRYAEALEYYQQALGIMRELDDLAAGSITLQNIGIVFQEQGRYGEALQQFQQALMVGREAGDSLAEGAALTSIGVMYKKQGRYLEALDYYQKALTILRGVGEKAGEAVTLSNIGLVYKVQGKYAEAQRYYQQALVIQQALGDGAGEGITQNNLGSVLQAQGRYGEALESFQQSLIIMRTVGNSAGEGGTLYNLGVTYQDLGQSTKALESYEQAMTVLETLRTVAGSESARSSFIAQYADLYDRTINLYYQENQPEKAFLTSERGRARSFLDAMATGYVALSDIEDFTLYNQEQEASAARQSARSVLAKAKAQTPLDTKLLTDLEAQLALAEKNYQTVLEAIAARGGQLAQLVPGRSTVLDVFQAQSLLDNQTTLLSFWVLDEQTLVFILTQKTFKVIALPITREDLYTQIQTFRAFDNTANAYPESAVELYQALIEPLKPDLERPHLAIIPHGSLHYLPFAALTDGSSYLIDNFTITYLPSISGWKFIQPNTGRPNLNPLILGNPTTHNVELKPLPFAESEAQAIATIYQTTPMIGQAATESVVKAQVGQAGVLHLAVHGSYNPVNPLYSAIYLAPDGENDGRLETHEIYGLRLDHTDLVVLSACETQLGQLSTGDELIGLTRAFFFAGTPSVLASLWSVDDQATNLLMEKFYTHWRDGEGKGDALRLAQIEMRAEYPNPYFWAAFVLSGEGGYVTGINPSSPKPIWQIELYHLQLKGIVFLLSISGRWVVWIMLGALVMVGIWVLRARWPEKPVIVFEGNLKKVAFVRNLRFSRRARWTAVTVITLAVILLILFEQWR